MCRRGRGPRFSEGRALRRLAVGRRNNVPPSSAAGARPSAAVAAVCAVVVNETQHRLGEHPHNRERDSNVHAHPNPAQVNGLFGFLVMTFSLVVERPIAVVLTE